jgi:LDH2 family malate/lactate/ureidoglycolate dehydrogenase
MGVVLSASQLHAFARQMLVALGMPDDDAVIVADSFVWAGLRDAITHSIIRIEQIAKRSRGGGLALNVDWTPVRAGGGVALLNAGYAWGTIGATRGMRLAVESARTYGLGMTSIRNCDNTGALGMHTSHAIEARMIGMAITNTTPFMPAWGGAKKLLGDQAFSIGAPAGRHRPVVLDESLGAEKLNVLREAAASHTPVAPNMLLNSKGEPTTDANDWLNGGMLLPAGGYRGAGIALMWEVLTGVLAGGHMLTEVLDMSRLDAKLGNSLFVMAIDPSKLMPIEEFLARMDRLVDEVQASPPMAGVERVRLPGERRERIAEERRVTGIPIPDDHVTRLRPLADELGVRFPED